MALTSVTNSGQKCVLPVIMSQQTTSSGKKILVSSDSSDALEESSIDCVEDLPRCERTITSSGKKILVSSDSSVAL